MLHAVLKSLREEFGREIGTSEHAVNCHHTTARSRNTSARRCGSPQGSVSARAVSSASSQAAWVRAIIVRGKGHAAAYNSCSHGAGRRLSRNAAKRQFTLDDLRKQTEGVECRKDAGVLDEIPGAYKNIDAVMAAQAELVEVVHKLKQIMCIKG